MEVNALPAKSKVDDNNKERNRGDDQASGSNVMIARSPTTVPLLEPEMWAKIFEKLPPGELQPVLNTCPEWNNLLTKQKTTILIPKVLTCLKGYLSNKDTLGCRLVSKACKDAVDTSNPQIPETISTHREYAQMIEDYRAYIQERARIYEGINFEYLSIQSVIRTSKRK